MKKFERLLLQNSYLEKMIASDIEGDGDDEADDVDDDVHGYQDARRSDLCECFTKF